MADPWYLKLTWFGAVALAGAALAAADALDRLWGAGVDDLLPELGLLLAAVAAGAITLIALYFFEAAPWPFRILVAPLAAAVLSGPWLLGHTVGSDYALGMLLVWFYGSWECAVLGRCGVPESDPA